jgi:hypothetical protein
MEARVMKRPSVFVKILALASSGLLVAGCISYRAGGFDGLKPPTAERWRAAEGDARLDSGEFSDLTISVENEGTGSLMFGVGTKPDSGMTGRQVAEEWSYLDAFKWLSPPARPEAQPAVIGGTKSDSGITGSIIFNERPQPAPSGPATNPK